MVSQKSEERKPTVVVNRNDDVPFDVYIGRPGPWGNPYHIGKDGTREDVIAKYRAYAESNPWIVEHVSVLRGKVLACWCKPQACHGDVLAEMADKA